MPQNNPTGYRLKRATSGQQAEAMKPSGTASTPAPTAAETDARTEAHRVGGKTASEEREEILDQEKINPVLKSKPKSQEEVAAEGGLGAVAARNRKKK